MLRQHVAVADNYIENLRYGVKAGMVNPEEACVAGKDAFGRRFLNILLEKEQGNLGRCAIPSFIQSLTRIDTKMQKSYPEKLTNSTKCATCTQIL